MPLALGKMLLSTSALNVTVSESESPKSTDPLNVARPVTVKVLLDVMSSPTKSSNVPSHLLSVLPIDNVPFVDGSI